MSSSQVSAPLPSSVIELLRDTGAAAAAASGQVHIVSVSAIREALGPRWPRRSAGIEDFVERGFRRGALADDLILRLNPVDFILVQPSWPPLGAAGKKKDSEAVSVTTTDGADAIIVTSADGRLWQRLGDTGWTEVELISEVVTAGV